MESEPATTAWAVLDALPVPVALLDRDGVLVAINERLRSAASGRGLLAGVTSPGSRFADLCARAGGSCGAAGVQAVAGLCAILQKETPRFSLDYRCGLADEGRWFELTIAPIEQAEGGAVLMQLDVTDRKSAELALAENDARSRGTFEHAAIGITRLSLDGRLLEVNARLCELFGYTREELLRKTFADLTVPEDLEAADDSRRAMISGATPSYIAERRYRRSSGEIFSARIVTTLQRNAAGEAVSFLSIVEDVTSRKRAEEALQKSEREQRRLAEQLEAERSRLVMAQAVAKVGSWETDLATLAVCWSEETHRIFEVEAGSLETTHEKFLALVHPEDRDEVDAAFLRSIEEETPASIEHRLLISDGRVKYIEERWQVVFDATGRAVRAIGTARDITERREREQELFEARAAAEAERLEADAHIHEQASMLDEATDAIFVRDLEGRVTYWNRSAERLYGWTADEILGQSVVALLYDDGAAFAAASEQLLATGAWSGEVHKKTRAGECVTIEARWTLLRDDAGIPSSVLAINTDVTEKRKLAAQFLRAQRMESIGTLAGGLAHDLNNILAPIVMGVSVLRRFEDREKVLGIITNIERSAMRGTDLVKQVLSFGRGIEGERVPVRLDEVVREVETIITSTFPKNIIVRRDIARDLDMVVGDPTQLNQVLLNLCVNARDAMPDGGRLTLVARNVEIDAQYASMNRAGTAGRYVSLEVTDDGCGMPREVMDFAFDPFFTTKAAGKGTGLGLSTALGIVRSHGGFVNVVSEVGSGSLFTVYLPAASAGARHSTAVAAASEAPQGSGELILLVDDETPILSVTSHTLEAFGYRTITAEDGAQAIGLYAMHRDRIALVITDMMMPVMDGPALIAALYRINPRVRIIAASGLSVGENMARAAQAGVRHFLAKPYSADAMLTLMREVLAEDSGQAPEVEDA